MEIFNEALLAKQLWWLLKDPASLVARLLGAKYYSDGDLLNASLRNHPSYIWRNLWSAMSVIL